MLRTFSFLFFVLLVLVLEWLRLLLLDASVMFMNGGRQAVAGILGKLRFGIDLLRVRTDRVDFA